MRNDIQINKKIAIYGFGNLGRSIAKILLEHGFNVVCFIDQKASMIEYVDGIKAVLPIDALEFLDANTNVVISVFNRDVSPHRIYNDLRSIGIRNVLSFNELLIVLKLNYKNFWFDSSFKIEEMAQDTLQLKNLMSDQESLHTLNAILNYRLNPIIENHPNGIGLESQYFSPGIKDWIPSCSEIVIVDCGAYDGDTIRLALMNNLKLVKSVCFEPDESNFKKLSKFVKSRPELNCSIHQLATWNCKTSILFSHSGLENSSVTSTGTPVEAIALDDFIETLDFNFLKVDVEGSDLETLKGAIKTIQRNRPYIAVSLYHRPNDLWDIPLYLNSNLISYKFYIRQHGHNGMDTVLYCSPN